MAGTALVGALIWAVAAYLINSSWTYVVVSASVFCAAYGLLGMVRLRRRRDEGRRLSNDR